MPAASDDEIRRRFSLAIKFAATSVYKPRSVLGALRTSLHQRYQLIQSFKALANGDDVGFFV